MVNFIALAIPFFFLLIGVELLVARQQKKSFYRFNDAINDLSCGVLSEVAGVFLKTVLFAGYLWLYNDHRLFEIPNDSVVAWIACGLGVDLGYYWFHRKSHEVSFIWATHVVHHQSEEYNLAVALRQASFQRAMSWVFYLPLALIGFPPVMFLTQSSFNTLYQFWIHTRTIGKMGPLEWVFNTPSHHRVHHGRNVKYLDKNYAGILIIWDRMFGTFQPEEEEPTYGVVKPLASWNPVWANFKNWVEMFREAARVKGWRDRLNVFLKPPGWHPDELGGFVAPVDPDPTVDLKYDTVIPRGLSAYVLVQFAVIVGVATGFIFFESQLRSLELIVTAALIVAALTSFGGLFERRSWAFPLEMVRLPATVALVPLFFSGHALFALGLVAAGLAAIGSMVWVARYRAVIGAEEGSSPQMA